MCLRELCLGVVLVDLVGEDSEGFSNYTDLNVSYHISVFSSFSDQGNTSKELLFPVFSVGYG